MNNLFKKIIYMEMFHEIWNDHHENEQIIHVISPSDMEVCPTNYMISASFVDGFDLIIDRGITCEYAILLKIILICLDLFIYHISGLFWKSSDACVVKTIKFCFLFFTKNFWLIKDLTSVI